MSESNEAIARKYDQWSATYESGANRTRDLAARALREQKSNLQDCDALEIGCGTGVNTRYLAAHCRSVVALDFSDGMLARARRNVAAANVQFVQQDLRQNWAVASDSIDLIVCTLVLEHIENLPHVFAEANRVLRAGGEFALYELHPFRQLLGGQAQFKTETDEIVLIPAFRHTIAEFVNTSIAADFQIAHLDELRDEADTINDQPPRLLTLHLRAARRERK